MIPVDFQYLETKNISDMLNLKFEPTYDRLGLKREVLVAVLSLEQGAHLACSIVELRLEEKWRSSYRQLTSLPFFNPMLH